MFGVTFFNPRGHDHTDLSFPSSLILPPYILLNIFLTGGPLRGPPVKKYSDFQGSPTPGPGVPGTPGDPTRSDTVINNNKQFAVIRQDLNQTNEFTVGNISKL